MSNWKNVNNWHWTEKDCLPWSQKYFEEKLKSAKAENDGIKVEVSSVTSVTGDVTLNQRKGKIITLYDISMKLQWKGVDSEGEEAEGRITVPEVAHDSEESDYVYEVTLEGDSTKSKDKIKQIVRKNLTLEITKLFLEFTKDLVAHHEKDVYIPKDQLGKPAPPRDPHSPSPQPQTPTKLPAAQGPTPSSLGKEDTKAKKTINTTTLKDSIEFVTSAAQLYNTLVDPTLVSIWTRSGAQVSKEIGSKFSLFGGNIHGSVVELVENKKIVWEWRSKQWPEDHFSTVTILLEEGSGFTNLILEQKYVPVGSETITQQNWATFYWNSIKSTFGYGATL